MTLSSGMTLLVANTARSLEHARLGAFGLVVTDSVQQLSKAQEREEKITHPSSPQLKQAPEGLRGSGHSRAKWPSPPQLEFHISHYPLSLL